MDRLVEAAAVDGNFAAAFRDLSAGVEGGFARMFGGVQVAATGFPMAFFNGAFVTRDAPASEADLAAAVSALRNLGVPFVVHLRSDLDPALRAEADRLGLVAGDRLPGMAILPRPVPDPPASLEIRRAADGAGLAAHHAAAAAGFGLPLELVQRLLSSTLLANSGVRIYAGFQDGVPVAASMGFRTDEVLGIYNVATIASARGRGYGTAMTWAVIADAEPGVEIVVLKASAAGLPVYERMGFRTVVEYEELESAAERPEHLAAP